uniref:Large ribosomal subunit protein uL4c n=1 Tax=Laurencieae sp. TaxID=2007162 RepID=A0A1Z1M2W7_9FLOR|nr:ribosomal protein L4 [Laurencieae sp.]
MTIIKTIPYRVTDESNEINTRTIKLNISESKDMQMYCIHRALKHQLTNDRTRNANTKTRSEVNGGGKKPWKQKGTGRARAGSTRSPLWRGGGVIFGPRKKKYRSKINKKEKKLAINTLLYNKFPNTTIISEMSIKADKPNTKSGLARLNQLGIKIKEYKNILIVMEKKTKLVYMSFRNIPNVELVETGHLNILSLLKADKILITHKALHTISVK